MPFTLHRTPEQRALEHKTAVDWRDLDEDCPWEDVSTAAARFLMDHAAVIAGGNSGLGSSIAATIAVNIEQVHVDGSVQVPPPTGQQLELIVARWILCSMYVNSLMDWNQAAKRAFRKHRFDDSSESDDEFDLPKTGWEERDRIETLLRSLDKCHDRLPEDWQGERTPLTDLLEESIAVYEAAPTTSSRRHPVARQLADTGSSSSSEDDFVITVGGEPLAGIGPADVFPGGDDEGRESEEESEEESETDPEMPGLIPPDGSETDTDFSEDEDDVTEEEMSAFMEALAQAEDTLNLPPMMQNLVETDEETESEGDEADDGWDMPNSEDAAGEFIGGRFVEHVE